MKESVDKLGQESAFPYVDETAIMGNSPSGNFGMSKRFYAAITLKVPDSGEEWLDEMIRKANRRDVACYALEGMLANSELYEKSFGSIVKWSHECADKLLK